MTQEVTTLDPETLERLRRQVPLRLDRQGQFFFEDDPVSHPGVRALFLRGLDTTPAGEPALRVGEQWCYLKVEDTPLRVVGVREEAAGLRVRLDDGRELALDAGTLWEEPDRGLRCAVPSQPSGSPLAARFTNSALAELAPLLTVDEATGAATLTIGGRPVAVPTRAPA